MPALHGNTNGQKWLPEQDLLLRKYRDEKLSSSLIAATINFDLKTNFSRNAIIGRLHRLGLCTETYRPIVVREKTFNSGRTFIPREPRSPPRVSTLPASVIQLRCLEIVPRNLTLIDLEPNDCRYPIGDSDYVFCGHPKMAGSSYCVPHFHLCREIPRRAA